MKTLKSLSAFVRGSLHRMVGALRRPSRVVTVFPKGTVVKYGDIPCELLADAPYYSATFQRVADERQRPNDELCRKAEKGAPNAH